jgi:O-antigen/teichoic acid export membrane protein
MQIFKQWPLYFLGRILPAAIAFGGIGVYTRLVDPASFGTYALLLSTSFLFGMTGFSWLRVAAIRMMATVAPEDTADYTATIALSFAGVSAIVAGAIVLWLRLYDHSLPLSLTLLTAAVAVASSWFELNISLAQARIQLVAYGVLQGVRAIVTLGASVLLIFAGFKAQALLGGFVIGSCVAFGRIGVWLPGLKGKPRREIFVRMFRFGWPSSAGSLSTSVATAQRYLLGSYYGNVAVGLFAVASDFTTQTIGLLIGTVAIAGQPLAFRARDLGAHDQLDAQLRNNARLLFAVGFAATAGIIALAGPIAHFFLGPKFRAGAEPVIIVVALSAFVSGMRGSYFEQAFEIALKTRPIAVLTAGRIAIALVPSVFLIKRYGSIGAAGAILLSEVVTLAATILWSRRMMPMPIPFGSFARIVAATLAMVGVIELIPDRNTMLGLTLAIIVGLVTYCCAGALMYFRQIRGLFRLPNGITSAVTRS